MPAPSPGDYAEIVERLRAGTIVPFFGAGASISRGLLSAKDLAKILAKRGKFPDPVGPGDLALVASYLVQKEDALALRDALRTALLAKPAQPGPVHRCLAGIEKLRLFVTTNYDDLIERALESREPWVVVDRGTPGNVWCRRHGDKWKEIEGKELGREITDGRPVVLKLHGSFDHDDATQDSFLITEAQYVDFLGRPEGTQVPVMLLREMRGKSFLFLGYGLKDWNVRVLLRKLASTRRTEKITSWAIVRQPGQAEQELWGAQDVEMRDIDLDTFVSGLKATLEVTP